MALLRKHDRLTPDQNDPWAIDKLDRHEAAKFLSPIVESITQPFVITIESGYGTGKTCFLDCWAAELVQIHTVVRFNAWETDFSHDPLAAFLVCMRRALAKVSDQDAVELWETGKKIMRAAAGKLPAILMKAALGKLLGSDGAKEALDAVNIDAQDISDLSVSVMEEALTAQEEAEGAREQFRNVLETVVAKAKEQNEGKGNLIILVDDLDRCRPTYTIELLESIKHFFSVTGVIFVLAIDSQVLSQSVRAAYGDEFDTNGYLRKFIDWRYRLPPPDSEKFAEFLAERFELGKLLEADKGVDVGMVAKAFGKAAAILELSLREQEQCFTELILTLHSQKRPSEFASEYALFIVYRAKYRSELISIAFGDANSGSARKSFFSRMSKFDCFGDEARFRACMLGLFIDANEAQKMSEEIAAAGAQGRPRGDYAGQIDAIDFFRTASKYTQNVRGARSTMASTILRRIEGITGPRIS